MIYTVKSYNKNEQGEEEAVAYISVPANSEENAKKLASRINQRQYHVITAAQ